MTINESFIQKISESKNIKLDIKQSLMISLFKSNNIKFNIKEILYCFKCSDVFEFFKIIDPNLVIYKCPIDEKEGEPDVEKILKLSKNNPSIIISIMNKRGVFLDKLVVFNSVYENCFYFLIDHIEQEEDEFNINYTKDFF